MHPSIPSTLDQILTPAWLSGALGRRFPGIAVTAVKPGPVISRVATNARFRIECAGGLPEGLSPDLCAKGYFSEAGSGQGQAGEIEARFYRDLAEASGVRTLRCVFADFDPASATSLLITEDVVARGATFSDARSDYTPDQAAQSLEQLARLHSRTWNRTEYARADWLESRLAAYTRARGVEDIRFNFEGPIGARVPEKLRDSQRLYDVYLELASLVRSATPWCVIHGDPHVGNTFIDADGRPSFLDWQLVQRGPWYIDVGYHIASALNIDDRRRTETDLVRHYLSRLASAGIEVPRWDDAWHGIRRGIVHGFYLWGITRRVDPPITSVLLERLGTAAADHDAYAAVQRR
jgi:hypothetical protein